MRTERTETRKRLNALRSASAGNYFLLLRLTYTNDPVDAAISLLKYKLDISEDIQEPLDNSPFSLVPDPEIILKVL